MKKARLLVLMIAMAVTSGCANSPALIKASSISSRSDVFQETTKGRPIPAGTADMMHYASVKTHKPGPFLKTTFTVPLNTVWSSISTVSPPICRAPCPKRTSIPAFSWKRRARGYVTTSNTVSG